MSAGPSDPVAATRVAAAVRRVAAGQRRRRAAAVALVGVAVVGTWLLSASVVDRWAALPPGARWASFAVTLSGTLWTVLMTATVWWRPDDPLSAARRIEAIDPEWGERLVTVITQEGLPLPQRGSPGLNAVLAGDVERGLARRPPVVRWPRRATLAAVSVAALWAVLCDVPRLDLSRPAARQLRPWAPLPPVTATRLDLVRPPTSVRQGRPLTIIATVAGTRAIPTAWFGPDATHLRSLAMTPATAGQYIVTFPAAQRDYVFRVTAGDAVAGPVGVRVLRPPGVIAMTLRLTYPPSAARPPLALPQSDGRLTVPAGTRVTVLLTASEPLKRVRLRVGDAAVAAKQDPATSAWQATFTASRSETWSIDLTAENGLHGVGPADMRIDVTPSIRSPAAG